MTAQTKLGRPKGQTLTPQTIVETAIACLEVEGESALGVNRISRQLNVKPPAIYKHLDGNAGLRRAVCLEGWRQFVAAYCIRTTHPTDAGGLLRQAAHQYRQFAHQHAELYAFVTNQPFDLDDPEFGAIYQDIAAFYQQALAPFCACADDVIDAGRMFHAALHGFVAAERAKLFFLPRSCEVSFNRMVETLIESLHKETQCN